MNLIILGPQGSGKGTQAELLASRFGLFHVESGKILRELSKSNERIRSMLIEGLLVPDKETIDYIDEYLTKNKVSYDGIIFDGYPRSISQYKLLHSWVKGKGSKIDLVIYLDVNDKTSVKRLSSRRVCEKCGENYNLITKPAKSENCDKCGGKLIQREDDKAEIIKKRLQVFNKSTKPILEIASKEGKLIKVNGERSIKDIFQEIASEIENVQR